MTAHKFLKIDSSGFSKEESGIDTYTGSGDAGKLLALDSSGKVHSSLIPSGGSTPLTRRAEEVTEDLWYVGDADVGSSEASSVWRIAKVVFTGNDVSRTYADGDIGFDNIWDNRAGYTYS